MFLKLFKSPKDPEITQTSPYGERKGIELKSTSWKGVAEEASGAYKDVDEVVKVSDAVGIGKLVARVIPIGVMKG